MTREDDSEKRAESFTHSLNYGVLISHAEKCLNGICEGGLVEAYGDYILAKKYEDEKRIQISSPSAAQRMVALESQMSDSEIELAKQNAARQLDQRLAAKK